MKKFHLFLLNIIVKFVGLIDVTHFGKVWLTLCIMSSFVSHMFLMMVVVQNVETVFQITRVNIHILEKSGYDVQACCILLNDTIPVRMQWPQFPDLKVNGMKRQKVEDVPELIHQIQSRLWVTEAARTSVLSKSWLHAWSTIPTLRFNALRGKHLNLTDIDRTLVRYLRDNIPIETFDLKIDIDNQESASHIAERWIGPVATKTSLKELSLSIGFREASFTLPDEILSGENLTKITVLVLFRGIHKVWMTSSQHPVINCVSLRELHLHGVRITEDVLHHILSSCTLLEKIVLLDCCKEFKNIKVKNLHRLYKLQIDLEAVHSTTLEISDVPNLGVFSFDLHFSGPQMPLIPFHAYPISLGRNVTQLMLSGVIRDNACLDKIQSGFPFLESLKLDMACWISGSFRFTSASIKRLSLMLCPHMLIDVQVNAPKLFYFEFEGGKLPDFSFPVSSLKRTRVLLSLDFQVDAKFFLKMRETLALSRKCYLKITTRNSTMPLEDMDMDELRTRLVFPPATNVEELRFQTRSDECQWERSTFFDAFFEICHPKHIGAIPDWHLKRNNHFCRLMQREVLEKKKTRTAYWSRYLKRVQIREHPHQNWKTLTSSPDGSAYLFFKLKWR